MVKADNNTKGTRGGARAGSGRPGFKYPTVRKTMTFILPKELETVIVDEIREVVEKHRQAMVNKNPESHGG